MGPGRAATRQHQKGMQQGSGFSFVRDYVRDSWEHTDAAPWPPPQEPAGISPALAGTADIGSETKSAAQGLPSPFPMGADGCDGEALPSCSSPHRRHLWPPIQTQSPSSVPCTPLPHHGFCIAWELVKELPPLLHCWLQPRRSRVAREDQDGFDFMPWCIPCAILGGCKHPPVHLQLAYRDTLLLHLLHLPLHRCKMRRPLHFPKGAWGPACTPSWFPSTWGCGQGNPLWSSGHGCLHSMCWGRGLLGPGEW